MPEGCTAPESNSPGGIRENVWLIQANMSFPRNLPSIYLTDYINIDTVSSTVPRDDMVSFFDDRGLADRGPLA
jgi:hypothetical protein